VSVDISFNNKFEQITEHITFSNIFFLSHLLCFWSNIKDKGIRKYFCYIFNGYTGRQFCFFILQWNRFLPPLFIGRLNKVIKQCEPCYYKLHCYHPTCWAAWSVEISVKSSGSGPCTLDEILGGVTLHIFNAFCTHFSISTLGKLSENRTIQSLNSYESKTSLI
jgi:hypothetical protein